MSYLVGELEPDTIHPFFGIFDRQPSARLGIGEDRCPDAQQIVVGERLDLFLDDDAQRVRDGTSIDAGRI